MKINVGDTIKTPRFLSVKISAVFATAEEARAAGFTEPTHYESADYAIQGRRCGENRMEFAAIEK